MFATIFIAFDFLLLDQGKIGGAVIETIGAMMKMRVDWKVEHVLMSQFIVNFFSYPFSCSFQWEPKTKTFDFNDPWKGSLCELFAFSRSCRRSKQWRNKRRLRVLIVVSSSSSPSHFPTLSTGFKLNWKSLVRGISPGTDSVFLKSLALHLFSLARRVTPGTPSFLPSKNGNKETRHRRSRPEYTTSWLQQKISSLD